jgi:hypothetical protein
MAATDGATLSTLSNILKEYYLGPVAEQLNNEVLLLSRLESRSEDLVGKYAYIPLHKTRSGGIGARAEQAALPVAGKQGYDKATYDLKYLYGAVQVTGPSVAKTKNEAGSFLQVLKSELDGLRNDLRRDLARQVYGDGTALIAQCGTTTASTTVSLNSAAGKEAIRKGWLYVGMLIDIGTTADVDVVAAGREINGVDYDNATITISGAAVTTSSSHYVSRAGSATNGGASSETSKSNEIDGLQRIVDADTPSNGSNTFGGIDPYDAGNSWWDNKRMAIADAAGNGVLSKEDLQKAINLVRLEGVAPTAMITSLGVQREFYMLLEDDVRYIEPDSGLNLGAGFKTLTYNGMPLIADIDAPYGRIYMIDESTMKVFSDQDWHFLDMDGSTLRQVQGYDVFEAVMARYMNIGVTRRNNQMVVTGIKVDTVADTGV